MFLLMLLLALAPSHRIVSVAPSITEILFALGAGDPRCRAEERENGELVLKYIEPKGRPVRRAYCNVCRNQAHHNVVDPQSGDLLWHLWSQAYLRYLPATRTRRA